MVNVKLLVCFVEISIIYFTEMYIISLTASIDMMCVLKGLYTITKNHMFVLNYINFKLHHFCFFKCAKCTHNI